MQENNQKSKKNGIVIAILLALVVLFSSIIVILLRHGSDLRESLKGDNKAEVEETNEEEPEAGNKNEIVETVGDTTFTATYLERPSLNAESALIDENINITPSVPEYKVAADFSNVDNAADYEYSLQDKWIRNRLLNEGFYVSSYDRNEEFFWLYEDNRYSMEPSFITVDSLMHTYHLYYSSLLKNVEKDYLSKDLKALSELMLENSISQYNELKGTEWESAAKRNVAFFAVGASLQGSQVSVPQSMQAAVQDEINKVYSANTMADSELFTDIYEDYSQYKPRGFYVGDANLEAYFRAMMWYGRMPFKQEDEDADRSALLVTLAMQGDAYSYWEKIYGITSFFCGASDDMGYCEYLPIIQSVYGNDIKPKDLVGQDKRWSDFHALTAKLTPPAINSIVVEKGDNIEIISYRFMGQRFTIDADIMQNLLHPNVEENSKNEDRMLPSGLDVMAALGSDRAYDILKDKGETDYKYFTDNMEKLRNAYSKDDSDMWSASLYSGWLYTLKPLLEEKGAGYPAFMQSESWTSKQLETFAGSYAELKHDTILYSKQVMVEMGDGELPEKDDRGYVQPEPSVYARFANLSTRTKEGLKKYDAISDKDMENLDILSSLAVSLMTISEKELQNETLTDDEYELIRCYGGNLEHFWSEAMKVITEDEYPNTRLYPSPVVADIATDPNGSVLEVATGGASVITVVVPVDGSLRIARGTVYSYYEFEWPQTDRLTDSEWKQLIGMEMLDDGSYNYDRIGAPDKPDWTLEYREQSN